MDHCSNCNRIVHDQIAPFFGFTYCFIVRSGIDKKDFEPTGKLSKARTFRVFLIMLPVVAVCSTILLFVNMEYFTLATLMLRIDLFSFVGKLAGMPVMYHELIDLFHWFDEKTFMDGVSLGHVTPGFIIIAATFFGYMHLGYPWRRFNFLIHLTELNYIFTKNELRIFEITMKVRDSSMPEERMWSKFFDPELILRQMEVTSNLHSVVDLGCGFGTFTIPASQIIKDKILAFDIDKEMIWQLQNKIDQLDKNNIELHLKDFIAQGTGLPDSSVDYVMLFNILHHEIPHQILWEVNRILKTSGRAGIIHWRSDIQTPRGPQLNIRPTPDQCKNWSIETGFAIHKELILEPYHFGIIIRKL